MTKRKPKPPSAVAWELWHAKHSEELASFSSRVMLALQEAHAAGFQAGVEHGKQQRESGEETARP